MTKLSSIIFIFLFFSKALTAQVGINADSSAPDQSAGLDVKFSDKGFLPPRMNTSQRNSIASPAEGLVIYNTDEKALNLFDGTAWKSMMPIPVFTCGLTITINHLVTGGVAPVNKTVEYGTTAEIDGETSKCWITSNLGSGRQANAVNDATEASAGWYWQFNLKQGYRHDGANRTPNTTWISSVTEYADWTTANDPCDLEIGSSWRIPTYSEWYNVDYAGDWTTWSGPWNSALKLHAAGYLNYSDGSLGYRGIYGAYWSSTQAGTTEGWDLGFHANGSIITPDPKAVGLTLRCLRENW